MSGKEIRRKKITRKRRRRRRIDVYLELEARVGSFGDKLRRAREARKLTLQDVAESTKISSRALQALEDERFDFLPGGIFNKGFVRAYARCVGLDEEKTVAEYLQTAAPEPVELDTAAMASQVTRPARPRPAISAASWISLIAVVVALGLGALWFREHRREAAEQEALQRQAALSAQLQPAPPIAAPLAASPDTSASNPSADVQAAKAEAVAPALPASAAEVKSAQPVEAPVAARAEAETQAPVEISVAATERAWVSVHSDGKPIESLIMDPASPDLRLRSYKAQARLTLIVGNAAGLNITYNGKPAGTLGGEGRRATIIFTPDGIQKN